MARRLGVMYVIYNRKIWSGWSGGWENYSGYSPHTDHVHISLSWNGARGHTSFWTGRVWRTDVGTCAYFANQPAVVATATAKERTRPCPNRAPTPRGSTQPTAWLGNSGGHVAAARRLLDLPAGSLLDRPTRLRILQWQRGHDLPRTGALDKPTWASLQPRTRQLFVPRWTPEEAAGWARDHGSPVLHPISAGTAVYALQTALRMPSTLRTGSWDRGPGTPWSRSAARTVWGPIRAPTRRSGRNCPANPAASCSQRLSVVTPVIPGPYNHLPPRTSRSVKQTRLSIVPRLEGPDRLRTAATKGELACPHTVG